ncbi:MAG TPA: T9SS type A sorting domain-containing protein [Kaistella sp.]|nr:T9SS type A sorting domain-containing protein [Kaistella sp.]
MKTNFIFLMLIICSFAKAQVNIYEGFESGSIPAGWTNNGYTVTNATSCTGTFSAFKAMTAYTTAELTTPSYVSTGNTITVSCDYKKTGTGNPLLYLQYYKASTDTWENIVANQSPTSCQTLSGNIPAGTIPSGSNVILKIYVYNSNANNASFYIDNFRAFENTPQTLAEYKFNNTFSNINGNYPFASTGGTSFVTDRHGNPTGALNINNTGTTAIIGNLPYGATSRTVSVWVKLNTSNSFNFVYNYGTGTTANGAYLPDAIAVTNFGNSQNHSSITTIDLGVWYHYVFSYNGTTSRIYKNGVLLSTLAKTMNTVSNSDIFRLGLSEGGASGYFNGAIDDLKIYNYVLSDSEVSNLYSTETLGVNDIKTNVNKIQFYPNPVKDILNIKSDSEISKVEVFSLEGKKLKESNQNKIDVSQLTSGVYIIKTTDNKGNIQTNKFIKN